MNIFRNLLATSLLITLSLSPLYSSDAKPEVSHVEESITVQLLSDHETISSGNPFWIAIRLSHADKWHSYWKNPGEVGVPTRIKWKLPEGFKAGPLQWPVPQKFEDFGIVGYGYGDDILLLTKITPPDQLIPGKEYDIGVEMEWLACSDTNCLPGQANLSIQLEVAKGDPKPHLTWHPKIEQAVKKLPEPSSWNITAIDYDDFIELTLDLSKHTECPKEVHFFPSEQNVIDVDVQPVINSEGQAPGLFSVRLKKDKNQSSNPDKLEGLVVISKTGTQPDEDVIAAIDLKLAVQSKADEFENNLISNIPGQNEQVTPISENPTDEPYSLIIYMLMAFAGGMILNLMPCVLPVISFKILSFVNMAGKDRKMTFKHGLIFSLGVLASFWVLATALLILQAYGNAVGWGFQLQQPLFVAILATIIVIFSLSMFGVFEIGVSMASYAGSQEASKKSESLTGSFFSGVLATTVATPCTGPFLGPAVGFAVTQTPFVALSIFTLLGAGMAFPYLLLSAFPSLLRFMPKPGNWMITFKELTGFVMLATAFWLLWVFGAQTDSLALFTLLGSLILISLSCWIWGKWGSPVKTKKVRIISASIALAILAFSGSLIYQASTEDAYANEFAENKSNEDWEPFSTERLAELQEQKRPVFIDFTARWCLICQANHLVLSNDKISEEMKRLGVVKMKADWTKHDSLITEELAKHGRNGVPLYLLYKGDGTPPVILPQVLTPAVIMNALYSITEQEQITKND